MDISLSSLKEVFLYEAYEILEKGQINKNILSSQPNSFNSVFNIYGLKEEILSLKDIFGSLGLNVDDFIFKDVAVVLEHKTNFNFPYFKTILLRKLEEYLVNKSYIKDLLLELENTISGGVNLEKLKEILKGIYGDEIVKDLLPLKSGKPENFEVFLSFIRNHLKKREKRLMELIGVYTKVSNIEKYLHFFNDAGKIFQPKIEWLFMFYEGVFYPFPFFKNEEKSSSFSKENNSFSCDFSLALPHIGWIEIKINKYKDNLSVNIGVKDEIKDYIYSRCECLKEKLRTFSPNVKVNIYTHNKDLPSFVNKIV